MKRLILTTVLALAALAAPAHGAQFGFERLDVTFADEEGGPAMGAGSHPFEQTVRIDPVTEIDPELGKIPAGQPRDLIVKLPAGLVGSPEATIKCSAAQFATSLNFAGGAALVPDCPDASAVGLVRARGASGTGAETELAGPVYNLIAPPGVAARLGFKIPITGAVTVDLTLNESPPYNLIASVPDVTQMQRFYGAETTLWSNPGAAAHDPDRGLCGAEFNLEGKHDLGDFLEIECPADDAPLPLITLPRRCAGPQAFVFEADSWERPGEWIRGEVLSHDQGEPPQPIGFGGCEHVGFAPPAVSSVPTSRSASSGAGLDFDLDIHDLGLTNLDGTAGSDIKKTVVTLPEGVTINPSQAEGLGVCSQADFARERSGSAFGAGCPAASKIGSVEVETPLLPGALLRGSVFVATPEDPATAAPENPFGTLIALYMTIKEPRRGVNVGIAGKVEPDPRSGQLVASFDDLPQTPFSHFHFHFREGARSPLITPPRCGTYTTRALFTPWVRPTETLAASASFEIDHGVGGGPCPPGGAPPFAPDFEAGSQNNSAGRYSPFGLRIVRHDGEQDLTKLTTIMPRGLVGRLAGTDRCPEAQIALAEAKSGRAELASPSCPANSRLGSVTAGAGVGSELTYVDGDLYLAGPYNGAPLSVLAVVPAVAGPFDVGTVVTRFALEIDPRSAEVRVDGDRSDPIPHSLAGIPLTLRDLRATVDRPRFTLNPTSCAPSQVAARLWGSGADPLSGADDFPLLREARYQAAGCASLAFKPRLSLRLRGGTRRGAFPALRLIYRPRAGNANLRHLSLRFPHSEFIEQGHFRTICTRVQFAAGPGHGARCPKGSVYGHATVFTPLLSGPLTGPVFLRSSNHNLPDAVLALHGPPSLPIDLEVLTRIDSVRGGLRATAQAAPDAPVTRAIVNMQGGRKGLFVNSTDLCRAKHRANVLFNAHNGRRAKLRPLLRPSCRKAKRHRRHHGRQAP